MDDHHHYKKNRRDKIADEQWKDYKGDQPRPTPQTLAPHHKIAYKHARRSERLVIDLYYKYKYENYTDREIVPKIAVALRLSERGVNKVIAKAALLEQGERGKKEIVEAIIHDKVPILKDVVGLSLNVVRDFLLDLSTNKEKKDALTVSEAKDLASIGKNLNEFLRLELGQATEKVEVVQFSFQQTKHILEDLSKRDKIFDYPALQQADKVVEINNDNHSEPDTGDSTQLP